MEGRIFVRTNINIPSSSVRVFLFKTFYSFYFRNRIPASLDYIMLFVILLTLLSLKPTGADDHHARCPCRIYIHDGIHVADCIHKNLTSIPYCIPNTTQRLEFRANDLRYISGQLQRFPDLSYLNLWHNENYAVHNDSFNSLPQLRSLNLGYTDFSHLTGDAFVDNVNLNRLVLVGLNRGRLHLSQDLFKYLGALTVLNLSFNDQLQVPNYVFIGLTRLKNLYLESESVLSLYEYSFWGLSALQYLSLKHQADQVHLPYDIFRPLTALEELHLEGICGAIYSDVNCSTIDIQLHYVPSIKRLSVDKGFVEQLGTGFLSLKNLDELHLANYILSPPCEVAELDREAFSNLRNAPLKKLKLDECTIYIVKSNVFGFLKKLTTLDLSLTSLGISHVANVFAVGLEHTNIEYIRLSLKEIFNPPEPFPIIEGLGKTNLKSLEMFDTNFCLIDNRFTTKLPKSLKYLSLKQNYVIYLETEALKYLDNLETLDLSNQIEFHGPCTPRPKTKKERKNSRIKIFPIKLHQLPNVRKTKCLSFPDRLKYLYLSNSRLLCVMTPAFCLPNYSLKVLNASRQRDRSCFETNEFWTALKNLAQLEVLNLDGNLIAQIPRDSFNGLHKLRVISLVDNKLIQLSFHVKDLTSLETLNLSANSIMFASKGFTSQIDMVVEKNKGTIYLDKNSLVCNCRHIDFVTWLRYTSIISNKNALNCTYENDTEIKLARISRVHYLLESECIMLEVLIGCVAMFSLFTLILGGTAHAWHNGQKLRYLLSYGRRTLNPYHPIENREIQMEYDVYISFEGEFNITPELTLRDFVIRTILPGLAQRGVNAIIREELDAGRNLYEIITQNVRRSKKVLVLLSRDYCQDMWNVFEFNQAVMEGIYTNRQVAIPVSLESLCGEHVTEEIYAFLRMEPIHTYSPELSDREFINFLYERISDTRKFG